MNPDIIEFEERIDRDISARPCPCGGYADRVKCTKEEIAQYGCGKSYECCSRSFVCRICQKRLVGSAEAPEMSLE